MAGIGGRPGPMVDRINAISDSSSMSLGITHCSIGKTGFLIRAKGSEKARHYRE